LKEERNRELEGREEQRTRRKREIENLKEERNRELEGREEQRTRRRRGTEN